MILHYMKWDLAAGRSPEIREALQADYERTDGLMLRILLAHWLLATTVMGIEQGYYLAGLIGGAFICGIAWLGIRYLRGTAYSRTLVGVCLMLFSALYIQQSLGRIEYHFHVFGAMAFLIRYKDLRPLLAAVLTIALHHLIFSYCQEFNVTVFGTPVMVFNYGSGIDIVLLHAAFVIFEAVFLTYIIVQLTDQFCDNAQDANDNLDVLNTLKHVITTGDLTARLDSDSAQANVVNELLAQMNANVVVREALGNASSSVVITDANMCVLDCNAAARSLFESVADDYRAAGVEIDPSAKNGMPAQQLFAGTADFDLETLETRVEHEFDVGERTLRVVVNPVVNVSGEHLGAILEWTDRSQELRIEREVHDMVAAASQGDLTRRISLSETDGFYALLGQSFNRLVEVADKVISDCGRVLSALADGDLTGTIGHEYQGEFGRLTAAVNTTVERLSDIVLNIKHTAAQVDDDASEIALSNTDLAERTRLQASSLEKTAASMEQMTSTVEKNATSARDASKLTASAREHAEQGGSVINEAVAAMREITAASEKIGEITGVIDEIAFQTNLLALNASVEAARAGDQGRGFAVVASEVRNLAGRSATAAKEINDLIEDSVRKVRDGARMVDESGQSLEKIVESVQKASDIVSDIAAASREQADGIQLVSTAIQEMDEVTQQNASLVAAAATASQSMGRQSRALAELVDVFLTGQRRRAAANDDQDVVNR